MSRSSDWGKETRSRLALEAARIMGEEGLRDFQMAKRKAAARLGVGQNHTLPSNQEIEAELRRYHGLFHAEALAERLQRLREEAREAMMFFHPFNPRLVGSVLDGTVSEHSNINLHVFVDTPEEFILFLMSHSIPYEQGERRFRFEKNSRVPYPVIHFIAGDTAIDVVVFGENGIRQAPRSKVDGKPMKRASLAQLDRLLNKQTLSEISRD
ncbi:MAG: hypothetical protein OEZ58_10785 [Gammaproteobacteria bacterium]|nr:hypothetical protein [Gammaproteobacteria bacterium]MDH5729467.1 hypothetical protein [Gammaproteobacteria bacterium]